VKLHDRNDSVPPLVSARWLAQRLEDPALRIIDVRPTILYHMEHIKNAVNAAYSKREYLSLGVDVSRGGGVELYTDPDTPVPSQEGPPEMIAEVLGKRLGISRDSLVVIYSDGADSLDTRFWWTLERLGHKRKCLLSGGMDKWLEHGYKTVKRPTRVKPVKYELGELDRSCQADTDWIFEHLLDPDVKLVFNSKHNLYYGQEVSCPREGHIPGSVCVPAGSHYGEDSAWKSPAELRRMYHALGITEDKTVVTYCLHGVASSTGYFALCHILGYPRVSLYSASKAGWCYDPRNLPLETYGNPQLLKDTQWVYYWVDQAHSRMNDTRVRVVDIRTADDYSAGHIPFAVSLPSGTIKPSVREVLSSPRSVRAKLGEIGISADTKVVIYDRGDTLHSAWLFWLLEYLGHRDVSILDGGFSKWQAEKRKVVTESTVIRRSKPKNVYDVSIPRAAFRGKAQPAKIASPDWVKRKAAGSDTMFINADASANAITAAIPEARSVPGKSSLTEEGVYKKAAQLAKVYYDDAGIDPFREVVCCAETPMPAALTYFTMRLLGHPRVRLYSET
jgi:thiosulfate/3-mercaptopyruvate sulfurtransferase